MSGYLCVSVCARHSPLPAVDLFSGGSSNNGPYEASEHPGQSVQIVNTTRILDFQVFLHEGLRMRKTIIH